MTSAQPNGARTGPTWARSAFLVVAWAFVAGTVVQVFLAGLGVFAGGANFLTHRDFGYLLELVAVGLIVLALVARLPRSLILGSVLLLVLFVLQSVFIGMRATSPAIAALHPVNGFAIVLLSIGLAFRARSLTPRSLGSPARSIGEVGG